jgi:hypothetical protein
MNEDWKVRELTEALRRSEANAAKDRSYIEQLRLELDKHRWISVEERMPTEDDVMKTDDDTHSYMNGLVLWYVEDKTGPRYYHFSKWYLPPKNYYKLISWKRIIPPTLTQTN